MAVSLGFCACAVFAGCVAYPEVDTRLDQAALDAPYPALVPLGPILAQGDNIQRGETIPADRLAALRARADRLRGPVIDRASRLRMTRGVDPRGL